jgi:hypothetical protein
MPQINFPTPEKMASNFFLIKGSRDRAESTAGFFPTGDHPLGDCLFLKKSVGSRRWPAVSLHTAGQTVFRIQRVELGFGQLNMFITI